MSWNVVLNKVIEIKQKYIESFGKIDYNQTGDTKTCLEYWVSRLNNPEYNKILSYLYCNQYGNLLLIKYKGLSVMYSDTLWDKFDGFYRECRGLVIDVANNCIVLAPFRKFFNLNEIEETSLENVQDRISKAKVIEFTDKLDGSMQSARWYNNQIVMAGSQAVNPDNSWRLQDGYRMINNLLGYKKMLKEHTNYTFIFEYVSLKDAHVVKYSEEQEGLYLIGIRDVNTGIELDYKTVLSFAEQYNLPTTQIFNTTLDKTLSELDDKTSDEAEGFVINIDGYKVKLKYNDYVYVHRVITKFTTANTVIQYIADNKFDDLLAKLPTTHVKQVKETASTVIKLVNTVKNQIQKYYDEAPNKEDKKEFMIYVQENIPLQYRGYCRNIFLGKENNILKSGTDKEPHYRKMSELEELVLLVEE